MATETPESANNRACLGGDSVSPPLSQGTNTSPMQREGTEEAEEGGDTYCGPNYVGAVLDIVYLT